MEYYFKLKLNNCSYWQSENIDGKKVYNKKPFISSENNELNTVYLKRINDNTYEELISKIRIVFDKNKAIYPIGVDIPLKNITPCYKLEILSEYRNIDRKKLSSAYRKIVNELFVTSEYCQIVENKKLGLRK